MTTDAAIQKITKPGALHLPDWPFLQNVAFLYLVHFANYVFPLVTIPYLVRTLVSRHFGAVAFAQSLMGYLEDGMDTACFGN
jgi:PST family polysaccharide transporter